MMLVTYIFCLWLTEFTSSDSINRPRGVLLADAPLYISSNGKFRCFDGSADIPYQYLNDDYCDCLSDGSDEPGTSACPNGVFHCNNIGHEPKAIPSSRVNDGICDCCDGSDEYDSAVGCNDFCAILGQEAREEEERMYKLHVEGNKLRKDIIQKGKDKKKEKQEKLLDLQKEAQLGDQIKEKKEAIKLDLEEKEKAALDMYRAAEEEIRKQRELHKKQQDEQNAANIFNTIDKNDDQHVSLEELSGYSHENRIITEDMAKEMMNSNEALSFPLFLEHCWSRIKELAHSALFQPPISEDETNAEHLEQTDETEDDDDEEEKDEEDDQELLNSETELEHETKEESSPKYDEHTQHLIDEANKARSEFEEADRNIRDLHREVKQYEESLGKDYGNEDQFMYMEGECYEYTDREYVYKVCPFDEVTQRPKNGGAEIRLGTWNRWYDNKYNTMIYNQGVTCWNGPARQALIKLECGLETEVFSATEPNRCEYLLQMKTPALCVLKTSGHEHDEL